MEYLTFLNYSIKIRKNKIKLKTNSKKNNTFILKILKMS